MKTHKLFNMFMTSIRLINIRGKQQRPSHTRRKAKARREQKLKVEDVSALQRMGEKNLICFALCLLSFITRGLQNNDHSTFACCLAQCNIRPNTTQ